MAKAGAKTRVIANAKRLKLLKIVIMTGNVFHVAAKFMLFKQVSNLQSWLGLGLTSLIYIVCFSGLAKMAEPTYGQNGELLDGGADLDMGGLCTYYHDLIYLAAFIQIATVISSRAWWIFLLVPLFAFYKLWVGVLQPYLFSSRIRDEAPEETPAERKKREKMERRQTKVRYR